MTEMNFKFWGIRGSVPSPLTPAQVEKKCREAFENGIVIGKSGDPRTPSDFWEAFPFHERSTFGGNTTCVELNIGDRLIILDMGTGLRELGKEQMKSLMTTKKLHGMVFQSHCHWDHIQGLPFWAPLYLPHSTFDCSFDFFGGKTWDSKLDEVYRGQMDAPYFPVNLQELEHSAMNMKFHSLWDGWSKKEKHETEWILDTPIDINFKVSARKLFHPQETFGYRFELGGKTLAFTTDHEPYAAGLPKPLMELVNGADVWITDCQYSHDDYVGKTGPQKMGWGHSFPEYVAQVGSEAKVKKIITTHHDPDASDEKIVKIAQTVQELCQIETVPAFEGMKGNL